MGLTSRFATLMDCVTLYFSYFESQAGSFCLSPRKAQGPKGLSQKVRDTAVIHNQASLRPCIQQRGITPVLSTGANAAILFTKKYGMHLHYYWKWPKWLTRQSHSGTTGIFQYLYASKSPSSLSEHSDKKVRLHALEKNANCLPISIHSISSPAGR